MKRNLLTINSKMPLFSKGISIIICCYNSAYRLPLTLDYISKQKVEQDINWEIIIVDNASTDNTVEIAKIEWLKKGNPAIDFSIVEEKTPGLSSARSTGIANAKYSYLLFCDDDNWLFEDYVSNVYKIFEKYPEVMIVGGLGIAKPELSTPPVWFEKYSAWYATGPQQSKTGILENYNSYVYGAGSAYRKSAITKLNDYGFISLLSDRKGNSLESSGDVELCYAVKLTGGKIFYSEDLKFYHFIPKSRLTEQYFIKLNIGMGSSSVFLLPYLNALQHKKISLPVAKILLSNIKGYVKNWVKPENSSPINYRKYQLQGIIRSVIKNYAKLDQISSTSFFKNIKQ